MQFKQEVLVQVRDVWELNTPVLLGKAPREHGQQPWGRNKRVIGL